MVDNLTDTSFLCVGFLGHTAHVHVPVARLDSRGAGNQIY